MPLFSRIAIEDDFISRKISERTLSSYGEADVAVNGEEVVQTIERGHQESHSFSVIYLEINLPGMDGHETPRVIRALEQDCGIEGAKIIVSTVNDDKDSIFSAFWDGCEAYVMKLFSQADFIGKLEALGIVDRSSENTSLLGDRDARRLDIEPGKA